MVIRPQKLHIYLSNAIYGGRSLVAVFVDIKFIIEICKTVSRNTTRTEKLYILLCTKLYRAIERFVIDLNGLVRVLLSFGWLMYLIGSQINAVSSSAKKILPCL